MKQPAALGAGLLSDSRGFGAGPNGGIPGLSLTCIILSSCLIAFTYETSIAFDRPVHTTGLILGCIGGSLLFLARNFEWLFDEPFILHASTTLTSDVPQEYLRGTLGLKIPQYFGRNFDPQTRERLELFVAVLGALNLRIELFREFSRHTECSLNLEITLPILISLCDLREQRRTKTSNRDRQPDDDKSAYTWDLNGYLKYFLPAIYLTLGGILSSSLNHSARSTYVCPVVFRVGLYSTALQALCVVLDLVLIYYIPYLYHVTRINNPESRKSGPIVLALLPLLSVVFWTVVGVIYFFVKPNNRHWTVPVEKQYLQAALLQATLFAILSISLLLSITRIRIHSMAIILGSIFLFSSTLPILVGSRSSYPPVSWAAAGLSITSIYESFSLSFRLNMQPERALLKRSYRWLSIISSLAYLILLLALLISQPRQMSRHPIDLFIPKAEDEYNMWTAKAKSSHDLKSAVAQYHKRYKQHPPPGFDKWYEYAVNRSSLVIDDFDQIHDDILPFRVLAPKELRRLTAMMASNEWNAIAIVSVRNGEATVPPNSLQIHRWMVEGATHLISPFAQYLPDMDIALNLNDECRVAVPWNDIEAMRRASRALSALTGEKVESQWSVGRNASWLPVELGYKSQQKSDFKERSVQNSFRFDGSVVCPPSSPARTQRNWNVHDLCQTCTQPHSFGQFIANWTAASDICHQPDLANLHGFFLSPSAFQPTNKLLPVFSQSKVPGFSDILYPSPFNYVDKVKYEPSEKYPDPSFIEKENTVFWRGSPSEGLTRRGEWQGMVRQRLVHLANNSTKNVPILLQSAKSQGYTYEVVPGDAIGSTLNLNSSIRLAGEKLERCWDSDCLNQVTELGLVPPSDFQTHWAYRYLVDMDGAGFSGRFLPFLQSNSLPFKTALFREWYDSRMVAWYHFVPLDLRLQGFWSTLAYFAGTGDRGGKPMMSAHVKEGDAIAQQGRKLAETALRKEDMEIYCFRLLLEWGRLTDDRRDDLGFAP